MAFHGPQNSLVSPSSKAHGLAHPAWISSLFSHQTHFTNPRQPHPVTELPEPMSCLRILHLGLVHSPQLPCPHHSYLETQFCLPTPPPTDMREHSRPFRIRRLVEKLLEMALSLPPGKRTAAFPSRWEDTHFLHLWVFGERRCQTVKAINSLLQESYSSKLLDSL